MTSAVEAKLLEAETEVKVARHVEYIIFISK